MGSSGCAGSDGIGIGNLHRAADRQWGVAARILPQPGAATDSSADGAYLTDVGSGRRRSGSIPQAGHRRAGSIFCHSARIRLQ